MEEITIMYYASKNVGVQELAPCPEPWNYRFKSEITKQIRGSKQDRQAWATNPETDHNFYTGIEPLNPNLRVSDSNPAHRINVIAVDYDVTIPDSRIEEAVAAFKHKPSWVETSLGNHRRLHWVLELSALVSGNDFATFYLQGLREHFALDTLPGLDEPALTEPNRLYANGGVWKPTGFGPVSALACQAYYVKRSKTFRWATKDGSSNVPLDIAEAELRKRYPNFDWPSDFTEKSQGPSFWIPESQSPMSAVVHKNGLSTWSAHATMPFYSWTALLGKEFVEKYAEDSMAKATMDCWWDQRSFWRKKAATGDASTYVATAEKEMTRHLTVSCKLSTKAKEGEPSQVETALNHIQEQQGIAGAAHFSLQRPGPMVYQGQRVLNLYRFKPLEPAVGVQKWGPQGDFPFLSALAEYLNRANPRQLEHKLIELQRYWRGAYSWAPKLCHNIVEMGAPGCGKTFWSRYVVAPCVGGFVDASNHIVGGEDFNSYLMEYPHWALDDDVPSSSNFSALQKVQAAFKKIAANADFVFRKKFHDSVMIQHFGQLWITANMNLASGRLISINRDSLYRTCLYQAPVEDPITFPFPGFDEQARLTAVELPKFLRFVDDMPKPDWIKDEPRYGIMPYHDSGLVTLLQDRSQSASFRDTLMEALVSWFREHSQAACWKGSVGSLVLILRNSPLADIAMRGKSQEHLAYDLERVQTDGLLKCDAAKDEHGILIWTFYRPDSMPVKTAPATPANSGTFSKP